jgi:hypothetical protein
VGRATVDGFNGDLLFSKKKVDLSGCAKTDWFVSFTYLDKEPVNSKAV